MWGLLGEGFQAANVLQVFAAGDEGPSSVLDDADLTGVHKVVERGAGFAEVTAPPLDVHYGGQVCRLHFQICSHGCGSFRVLGDIKHMPYNICN